MFRRGIEDLKDEAAYAEKLEEADSKRSEDFMRLGAFYDDVFYAAIESIPYMVRFDGHLCKMSGIGGVISDFNAPVKGAMKEIYKEALAQGFDPKYIKKCIALRKKDKDEIAEEDEVLSLYRKALGI